MLKYLDIQVGFREFPDEISLLINISNCPFHCPECHSPELWEDIGTELSPLVLTNLISENRGITLIGFMGGPPNDVDFLVEYIKYLYPSLKIGWYWGGNNIPESIHTNNFDYIKIGPYIKEKGGLDNPNTNQKMYEIIHNVSDGIMESSTRDITYKFWKNEDVSNC